MMSNLVKLPGFKRNPPQARGSLKVQFTYYFYAAVTRFRLDSPHPSLWHTHALTHALRFLQRLLNSWREVDRQCFLKLQICVT